MARRGPKVKFSRTRDAAALFEALRGPLGYRRAMRVAAELLGVPERNIEREIALPAVPAGAPAHLPLGAPEALLLAPAKDRADLLAMHRTMLSAGASSAAAGAALNRAVDDGRARGATLEPSHSPTPLLPLVREAENLDQETALALTTQREAHALAALGAHAGLVAANVRVNTVDAFDARFGDWPESLLLALRRITTGQVNGS